MPESSSASSAAQQAQPQPPPLKPNVLPSQPEKGVRIEKMNIFDSLSVQEKINFARHLSIVIKAGIPLYQGLNIIKPQTESRTLKKILTQLIADIGNGRFLADGLARYEDVFGPFFVNIIRVGESSGTLAQNLLYLADELKKSKDLQ